MIHKKINAVLIIAMLLFTACQKDKITSDVTIKGNVRNNCTGKGFANVEVKFLTMKSNTTSISTITNANGDFTFSSIEMHSSNKYSYALNIERHSYYNYNFDGVGPYEINLGNVNNFQQFGTTATFINCPLYLPTSVNIISPDTFSITLEQKILHFYEPNRVYKLVWPSNICPPPHIISKILEVMQWACGI